MQGREYYFTKSPMTEKEEYIEADILEYLTLQGVSCEKIVSEGYYDKNKWIYRTRKSAFVKNWTADIAWTIPPRGLSLHIEVKKPEEMKFFDHSIQVLTERMIQSKAKSKTKYLHAIAQREYLDEKIKVWWVAFFASSVQEVIERLKEFWVEVT